MAEVTAAGGAEHLGALHAEGRVGLLLDRLRVGRRRERGPAAAGVVLGVRLEELGPTTGALVGARLEAVVVLTSERPLGPLLPQDAVLLGAQLGPPLLFCFLDFVHAEQSAESAQRYARKGAGGAGRAGPSHLSSVTARARSSPARRTSSSRRCRRRHGRCRTTSRDPSRPGSSGSHR